MKKGILVFLFSLTAVLLTNISFSQIRKIPSNATENLKQKYPGADNVEWKDALSHFTAKFQIEGDDYEAHFDNEGNFKESMVKIDQVELPGAVKDGLAKSKYSDWTIDKVEKIESGDGKVRYRFQAKSGDVKKKILYFTPEGKLAKDNITLWF
jgi:hypothetical protein